jgi:23S rRNA (uracil1939-C5)-methyltransferase
VINGVAAALKRSLSETSTTCYSDAAHAGLVRGAQVSVERASHRAQVVVVCNAVHPDGARPLLAHLADRLAGQLHSLWWNGNPEASNRVLGPHWHHLAGPPHVVETLGGARVFFPPGAFGQNNLDLFERLLIRAHGWVPAGSRVTELYAGCGAIGLGLVDRAEHVVFNEISPDSVRGLRLGIADLPPSVRQRASVIEGPAGSATSAIDPEGVLIVDPPRKGMDADVLEAIARRPPARLIYVSCGPEALMRQSETLHAAGLRLREAVVYDLFPYTEHVETLARFDRR